MDGSYWSDRLQVTNMRYCALFTHLVRRACRPCIVVKVWKSLTTFPLFVLRWPAASIDRSCEGSKYAVSGRKAQFMMLKFLLRLINNVRIFNQVSVYRNALTMLALETICKVLSLKKVQYISKKLTRQKQVINGTPVLISKFPGITERNPCIPYQLMLLYTDGQPDDCLDPLIPKAIFGCQEEPLYPPYEELTLLNTRRRQPDGRPTLNKSDLCVQEEPLYPPYEELTLLNTRRRTAGRTAL
ncbi:hypothetical protein J6590_070886 [Homalodisca vitripennis]|nr:hypothetical protein J6590_070886 [Homalodisca vitripennis]